MLRLSSPTYTFENALEECISGITGNPVLLLEVTTSKANVLAFEKEYLEAGKKGELYKLNAIDSSLERDPIVLDNLRKSDLVKVYEQYFVPEGKPARVIYDALMNAALEKCPFCGGLGRPHNLDHFLPKKGFPQFSVLPRNLVPACLDCNLGEKGQTIASKPEEQIIQPYIDDACLFDEQWIFARYNAQDLISVGAFEYFVRPPAGWAENDKIKAKNHFEAFGLGKRYATRAAGALNMVLLQVQRMRAKNVDTGVIKETLLQPGIDAVPFINHWRRGMYQALMDKLN
jgi:hypothetical protein